MIFEVLKIENLGYLDTLKIEFESFPKSLKKMGGS
jgi:hypothetical protein